MFPMTVGEIVLACFASPKWVVSWIMYLIYNKGGISYCQPKVSKEMETAKINKRYIVQNTKKVFLSYLTNYYNISIFIIT